MIVNGEKITKKSLKCVRKLGLGPQMASVCSFQRKNDVEQSNEVTPFSDIPMNIIYIYVQYIYIDLIILEHGVSQNDDTTITNGNFNRDNDDQQKHGFRQTRFIRYQTRCTYSFI